MTMWRKTAIAVYLGLGLVALLPPRAVRALPEPPPNGSPSEGTTGGGTRGDRCEAVDRPFTPLLPESDRGFAGSTLSDHPSFWFYVPYSPEQSHTGRFVLINADGTEVIYQTSVTLAATPGFVQVAVPNTAPALAVGDRYRWQFTLYCGDPNALVPDFVVQRGSIQRIDPATLTRPIDTDDLTQQVRSLVQNQLWYDATADLAAIQARPDLWSELLAAIGLSHLEAVTPLSEAAPGHP